MPKAIDFARATTIHSGLPGGLLLGVPMFTRDESFSLHTAADHLVSMMMRVLFLLLLLGAFGCATSPVEQPRVQEDVPRTAQEYFERGYVSLAEDDYQGAIRAFTRAIELDPSDPRYYRARAGTFRVLHNNEAAQADYTAAIALTPPSDLARTTLFEKSLYELRAAARKEGRDYRGAAEDLTKLIALNPGNSRVYVQRAEIYELEGNWDAAIEDMTRAIELGQSPSLYAGRAKLRERKGDVNGAIADCVESRQAESADSFCSRLLAGSLAAKKVAGAAPAVKEPDVEVATESVKRPSPPPETPEPQARLTTQKKPTGTPLPETPKPQETIEYEYSIQVATLVLESNVVSLKAQLERLGYRPIIQKTTARITRHHVFGGEFTSRQEAERTAHRLLNDGFASTVVEGQGGSFLVEVGSFLRLDEAIDLAHRLQKKTYTPKIVSQTASTPVHEVRVGAYQDRAEALRALESLRKEGLAPLIVKH